MADEEKRESIPYDGRGLPQVGGAFVGGVGGGVLGGLVGAIAGPVGAVAGASLGTALGSAIGVAVASATTPDEKVIADNYGDETPSIDEEEGSDREDALGIQTGGRAMDGTPDTGGVMEITADVDHASRGAPGDSIDDKTGKRV